jgi:2-(1,2-epoxy-1,2-dihydrophenyl)acetyl-CoA isomerase
MQRMTDSVLYEVREGVAVITLNRPDRLNAFDKKAALALQSRLDEAAAATEVRAVLLTGTGKGFSAGQDLAEVVDPTGPSMAQILSEHYNPIVRRIRSIEKPVVAAVNGVAAGAGANIALCCDVVLASEEAVFIQAFSKIGLIPDSGGTWFLPRLIGWQKASALMMTGDRVTAKEAESMGMVYRVVPAAGFMEAAMDMAKNLALMPTRSFAFTKQALNESFRNTLDEQLDLEDRLQQRAAATSDYREGVEAFLAKRKPDFKGE